MQLNPENRFKAQEARAGTVIPDMTPQEPLSDEEQEVVNDALVHINKSIIKAVGKGQTIAKVRYESKGSAFAKPAHIKQCLIKTPRPKNNAGDSMEKTKYDPTLSGLHVRQALVERGFNVVLGNTGILISW